MFRSLALLLAPALLSGQRVPDVQSQELAHAARDPYDLARFIDSHLGFDWAAMWKALDHHPLFIQPCGKLSGGKKRCSTELITVLSPDQMVLVIQGDGTPADI